MNITRTAKVALASRRLFRNWLWVGIRYLLHVLGVARVDYLVADLFNGCSLRLRPWVYSSIINAYYDGVLSLNTGPSQCSYRLWGVVDLLINDGDAVLRMPDGILLSLESFDMTIITETWIYDIHFLGFDLRDWLVIDVGAFVGDTALYYARRGAFVIAVEPHPGNFRAMLRNIELNPEVKHRVLPINAAIAGSDGFVEIKHSGVINGGADIYRNGIGARVRSMKLSTLISEVGRLGVDIDAFRVRALKMDCKGCEYDVINERDVLRIFDIIKVEYSGYLRGKTYHELRDALEGMGFKCRVWAHNEGVLRVGLDRHGTITCMKGSGQSH